MDIAIKNIGEATCACDVLILPVIKNNIRVYDYLGTSFRRLIKKSILREFIADPNALQLLAAPDDIGSEWILLTGIGRKNEITADTVRQAGGKVAEYLKDKGLKRTALSTRVISSLSISPAIFVEGILLGVYRFDRYKTEQQEKHIDSITILARMTKRLQSALSWAKAAASSVNFARDLVNTPSNDMTPSDLAEAARTLRQKNLSITVLDREDARKLGMGAYLSVARGSTAPPKFIILRYKGAKGAPLVLVGKSITFDSGGISLKPSHGMEKMKYDMAGGAAVLGVMKAVAEMKLPVHVIGLLPATENLPGSAASKPGDIVRSVGGKTIEVVNTDAEGRLVLADAIEYAKRFKPRAIIDIATLTGACSIALGNEAIAMMGNDRRLLNRMKRSSEHTNERVWEMPLFEEYHEYLKSDIADLNNLGGKNGALVTSAYFLYVFAGSVPWVHLDIAGTGWIEKERPYLPKGASGAGVRLLIDFVREMR
ncbi:MAG: leucyl aminopeptidase [Nitrospiraceae bacterium]|nr:MAG: leucyl aminopeptidase [Nitrospiraceae bacterium]